MKITLCRGDLSRIKTDLIVIGMFEGQKRLQGAAAKVNAALKGAIQKLIREVNFEGACDKTLMIHTLGRLPAKEICLMGLGKEKGFTLDRQRRAFAGVVKAARKVHARQVVSTLLAKGERGKPLTDLCRSAAEGLHLGAYRFRKYLTKEETTELRQVSLLVEGTSTAGLAAAVRAGTLAAEATNFTRDLVNEPGNVITPITLAATARKIARREGLHCKILAEKEIAGLGMGAYLGVAQGSTNPPRFIHLTYRPRKAKKSIALIGKGITFDSGGLSLKPSEAMATMKMDKSGACTVLGVMQALPKLKPSVTVHGIIAAAENMPSGTAQRPDDIVRAMNGKTIEVLNTDAEGRLTLADALSYAARLKPDCMIDLATLTGACVVALGEYTAGVMGNDESFLDEFLKTAKKTGELMWPLPFDENMMEKLKGKVADLKNIGNRWGGAITAGMFLREFVNEIPWIHIDIAGPAFSEKPWGYNTGGATGIGVRTVLEYLSTL
ncbi:MAG: leucyl aminopeptidase [Deltaproteobacteria bacterium]|nr:leucyl aminopeptidase [Deltaproteobacteria bacterium]